MLAHAVMGVANFIYQYRYYTSRVQVLGDVMKKGRFKCLYVYLSPDLYEKVKMHAVKEGLSMSYIAKKALKEYLKKASTG